MRSRTVANYMMSMAAIEFAPFLSKKVQKIVDSLDRALTGVKTMNPPRWKTCLKNIPQ